MQNQRADSRRFQRCFPRTTVSPFPARPILRQFTFAAGLTLFLTLCCALISCGGTVTSESGSGSGSGPGSGSGSQPPTPDFSLTATPSTVNISTGAAGSQVALLATPSSSFSGTVSVAISNLPGGVTASPSTINLTPGNSQPITLVAAYGAAASMQTITLTGASGGLSHAASLTLTVRNTAPDITTYHYNNARDGLNAQENVLTLNNVNSTQFGKVGLDTVDGRVDGEPLYLANVTAGGSLRDVLYVVTEHDSVYAFDADTGAQIWKTSILGSGETTSDPRNCDQITPEIGITSTPVIDRNQGANGTLYHGRHEQGCERQIPSAHARP